MQNENWQGWGINQAVNTFESIVQSVIGILGAAALTVSLFICKVPQESDFTWLNSPLISLLLAAFMLLVIWFGTSRENIVTSKIAKLSQDATMGNRVYTALFMMTAAPERRLDIRTYRQQKLIDAFSDNTFAPGGTFDRFARSFTGIMGNIGKAAFALFTGAVYVFTCLKAWAGAFGIGSVTQYVGAVTALSANLSMLFKSVGLMRSNAEFLQETYDFLEIPNSMYQGSLTTEKRSDRKYQVEFKDVSFRYPGSD